MLDLVLCIFGCDTIPKYKNQILKINETYGKVAQQYKQIRLLYFLGEEQTDLIGPNYIHLPGVKNDYLSASYKQYLGLKYIYEKVETKFVICFGTDTYLNIPKLMLFLQKFNPENTLYIGGHGCHRMIGDQTVYFHSGGPGFILSKTCLSKIYHKLDSFVEEWIEICKKNGTDYLLGACDVGIAYLVQLPEYQCEVIKTNDLSFLHCNYKGYSCHYNQVNIQNIISCHLMGLDDFDEFTRILEKNHYFV